MHCPSNVYTFRIARGPIRPAGCGPIFLIGPRAVRAEYNRLRDPRAEILAGLPENRDDIFNCHEVPIKEYLRK